MVLMSEPAETSAANSDSDALREDFNGPRRCEPKCL